MRNQNGISLIELLVVVAVASLALVTTVAFSMPWMAKETMRSAAQELQAVMQLTRIEAVSRNHACRFVLNTELGQMQVWDTRGTGGASDDQLLHSRDLPSSIVFLMPDASTAVTLQQLDTNLFQTLFRADGTVSAGSGSVAIHGGEGYGRISVEGAGGTRVAYWNGSEWYLEG